VSARQLHAAPFDEALSAYMLMTAWWSGYVPVRLGSWADEEYAWRQGPAGGLPRLVRDLENRHDDDVLLGLPMNRPNAGGVARVSVLWSVVEGKTQLGWARRFRPLPSLVLQVGGGSRRIMYWWLEETVQWAEAVTLNKRLAYKFGAVQKFAHPDLLWVNAPGTSAREGRARPAPVRVARLTTASYQVKTFRAHRGLKDPPAQDWMMGGRR
jgi:hypothetical protein